MTQYYSLFEEEPETVTEEGEFTEDQEHNLAALENAQL
jgi:hypothetical protein